jgi:hypothetical protein
MTKRQREAAAAASAAVAEQRRVAYEARKAEDALSRELAELPGRVREGRRALEILDTLEELLGELSCLTSLPMPHGYDDEQGAVPVDHLHPHMLAATIAGELRTNELRFARLWMVLRGDGLVPGHQASLP